MIDDLREFRVDTGELELNVLELGNPGGLPLLCVHGLRDTAHALVPVFARAFAEAGQDCPYRILIPELRGHGSSAPTDAFAMPNFLQDIVATMAQENLDQVALFGHSLGGHVVTRFAALWPERVAALVVVEGLGPPRRPHEGDEQLELSAYRFMVENRLQQKAQRPMPSLSTAVERLQRNNPRLDPSEAERLAPHLTRLAPDGRGLVWSFDSRAAAVFIGSGSADNEKFWRAVQAPTCIIAGTLSHEYWGREMADNDFTGCFAEGELENRAAQFPRHELHWFEHSGHMVHYDEPDRLGRVCREFLEKHYV